MLENEIEIQELGQKILDNVKWISKERLEEAIKERIVTLPELQDTGNLSAEKRLYLEPIWKEVQEEDSFWDKIKESDSPARCEEYLEKYPDGYYRQKVLDRMEGLLWEIAKSQDNKIAYQNYIDKCRDEKYQLKGRYIDDANKQIEKIEKENEEKKQELLNDILNNTEPKYRPEELQKLIDQEEITEEDLYGKGVTKRGLDTYLNPPRFEYSKGERWSDLPPLPKGNTDIYLFGNSRSGKTCILAGLFAHGRNSSGKLNINNQQRNLKGVKFANELISKSIKTGYTPPPTPIDVVNYIPGRIKYYENKYDVSFIEMSGEYFRKSYEGETIKGENSIGANEYLANNNNKSILLVIDYNPSRNDADHSDLQSIFLYVLSALDNDGTLIDTDAIQIVVTKADLIESNRAEEVNKYIKKHYSALLTMIRDLNERYDINPTIDNKVLIHPFSLGKFMLQRTFEFDESDSERLLNFIAILSRPTKKKN